MNFSLSQGKSLGFFTIHFFFIGIRYTGEKSLSKNFFRNHHLLNLLLLPLRENPSTILGDKA
jgi:hypothetical protein